MKTCINCNNTNKDTDKYCRNCGLEIRSSNHYVLINILTILAFLFLIFVIVLFATLSFMY